MNLEKYISEAISRGRTSTRYSVIQDLDFGMEIVEFWDKLVEIGVPDSTEDAKTAKVRKDILDHKGIMVRKYLTAIYLFVGSSDHYYFVSNDLGHDPREVSYISRNDRGAFPKEIGDQALDSLKKDLEDLSKSGEINEAISSGKLKHGAYVESGFEELYRIIDWNCDINDFRTILEESGYKQVEYYTRYGVKYSRIFSGNKKEFAESPGLLLGELIICNENDKCVMLLGFDDSGKLKDIAKVVEVGNMVKSEDADMLDLIHYLTYGVAKR